MNHSVVFFFFLLEKVSVWQPVTLHITSAWHLYPGCHGNVVAMRSIYLEIWQLQMSLGAALNNKALVKLQTVKAHTHFFFWPRLTEEILIRIENVSQVSDNVDIFVCWILRSLLLQRHLPSSHHSVKHNEPNAHCEVFSTSDEYHKMSVKIKVQLDIQSLPSSLPLLSHPPPLQRLSAARYSAAPAWRMLCTSDVWICTEVGIPPTSFPMINIPEQHVKIS